MGNPADETLINFRAPSADLDKDLAAIHQKVIATSAKLANTPPVPIAATGSTYGVGPGTARGGTVPVAPYTLNPYGLGNPVGYQGPLLPGAIRTAAGQYNAIRNSVLGDNELPAGFLNGPGRPGGGRAGGVNDTLALAGNIYAASRVAHVAARGLDAFGSYEEGQRAAARGDLAGVVRGNEAIKSAAEGLPLGVGTLAVAIRNNVFDRADRAAIEQTQADTVKLDSRADYAQVRADRLGRGQREITATARGLEGNVERSALESRYRSVSEQERELNEQDARADPGLRQTENYRTQLARARAAISDQRRTADRDAGRFAGDQSGVAEVLGQDLAGNSGEAARLRLEQSIEGQRRLAQQGGGASGQAYFDREIAPKLQAQFSRDQGNQRLAASGESERTVAESASRVKEIRLKAAGEIDAAELQSFKESWDRRVEVARQAVATTTDVRDKGLRQNELNSLEGERAAATADLSRRQGRDLGNANAASAGRIQGAQLRTQGRFGEASDVEFERGWQDRIDATDNAAAKGRLIAERDAARAERGADKGRENQRLSVDNQARTLSLANQPGSADALRIRSGLTERLAAATGDPARQRLIREGAAIDAREAINQVLAQGPNRGQIVDNFANADLRNTAARKDTAALEKLLADILGELKRGNKTPAVTS